VSLSKNTLPLPDGLSIETVSFSFIELFAGIMLTPNPLINEPDSLIEAE
jgi:hypothetical protein